MGDFSGIVPLTGSPLRYLAKVSYEKGWPRLKSLASIFGKIKQPFRMDGPREMGPLVEEDDKWWSLFCFVPPCFLFAAFSNLVLDPGLFLFATVLVGCIIGHMVLLICVIYWHRERPFQLIGAKAKFMIEVIPMITAAAMYHLLEFNYGYLDLLLACTTYFYAFAHFMHITYDIGAIDVLLGIVLQVLAYALNAELFVRALALSLCLGLSFYRYMMYCAPELPAHRKKEVEQLPC